MDFYTYLWLREDGSPYYVGKGSGFRAFSSRNHSLHCPSPERIIVQFHESEADAFEAEKFLIAFYGRKDLGTGSLRNLTDGGEGSANPNEHTRQMMRMGGLRAVWATSKAGKIGGKISGRMAVQNGHLSRIGKISAKRRAVPSYHRFHVRIHTIEPSCKFCCPTI